MTENHDTTNTPPGFDRIQQHAVTLAVHDDAVQRMREALGRPSARLADAQVVEAFAQAAIGLAAGRFDAGGPFDKVRRDLAAFAQRRLFRDESDPRDDGDGKSPVADRNF